MKPVFISSSRMLPIFPFRSISPHGRSGMEGAERLIYTALLAVAFRMIFV